MNLTQCRISAPSNDREEFVKSTIRFFANAVTQRPGYVIAATLIATLVFGGLAATIENSDGQEGFSPENEVILASERINELFGDSATQSVMQVVVRSDSDDLISADGLVAANAVTQALLSSDQADFISGQSPQQPGVVTWMAPVQQAVAEQGLSCRLGRSPTSIRRRWSRAASSSVS
jgi:hypothetical protein